MSISYIFARVPQRSGLLDVIHFAVFTMNRNDPTQKGKRKNDRTYYTDHVVRRRPCFRAETVFICMYVYTYVCKAGGPRGD